MMKQQFGRFTLYYQQTSNFTVEDPHSYAYTSILRIIMSFSLEIVIQVGNVSIQLCEPRPGTQYIFLKLVIYVTIIL